MCLRYHLLRQKKRRSTRSASPLFVSLTKSEVLLSRGRVDGGQSDKPVRSCPLFMETRHGNTAIVIQLCQSQQQEHATGRVTCRRIRHQAVVHLLAGLAQLTRLENSALESQLGHQGRSLVLVGFDVRHGQQNVVISHEKLLRVLLN